LRRSLANNQLCGPVPDAVAALCNSMPQCYGVTELHPACPLLPGLPPPPPPPSDAPVYITATHMLSGYSTSTFGGAQAAQFAAVLNVYTSQVTITAVAGAPGRRRLLSGVAVSSAIYMPTFAGAQAGSNALHARDLITVAQLNERCGPDRLHWLHAQQALGDGAVRSHSPASGRRQPAAAHRGRGCAFAASACSSSAACSRGGRIYAYFCSRHRRRRSGRFPGGAFLGLRHRVRSQTTP
jgi:hypothetical protein